MAGIGFSLQRPDKENCDPERQRGGRYGAMAIIGPWIFAILAFEILRRSLGLVGADDDGLPLQSSIIYLFLVSLVSAAPVTAIMLRMVFDDIHRRQSEHVVTIYLLALAGSMTVGLISAQVAFGIVAGFPAADMFPMMAAAGAMAMTWTAATFAAAIRAYKAIGYAFMVGFALAVVATLFVAGQSGGPQVQALAFACGFASTFVWLSGEVIRVFDGPSAGELRPVVKRVLRDGLRYRTIGFGAFAAAAAIWTDSIVVWFGPFGEVASNGLSTMPFYDSAMFVSRISMLPGLLVFLAFHDGIWFDRMQGFLRAVNRNEALERIMAQSALLEGAVRRGLLWLIAIQSLIAVMLYVLAPALIEPFGMMYQQTGILRVGLLGTLFFALFSLMATLVLYLGRDREFLRLQLAFLVLNGLATYFFMRWGADYLGFGFLVASVAGAVFAAAVLEDTLNRLPYITFANALRNSRNVYASRAPRRFLVALRPFSLSGLLPARLR
jgi:uncharacterized membrane protein